jgi:transposase
VSERINSQSTIKLYEKIIQANPEKEKIYIVRDNAMYYKSAIVKDFLEKNPQIIELALPPYSPNLNSIERLWHFFKKKVTYNKYYEHFTDFEIAVEEFFDT